MMVGPRPARGRGAVMKTTTRGWHLRIVNEEAAGTATGNGSAGGKNSDSILGCGGSIVAWFGGGDHKNQQKAAAMPGGGRQWRMRLWWWWWKLRWASAFKSNRRRNRCQTSAACGEEDAKEETTWQVHREILRRNRSQRCPTLELISNQKGRKSHPSKNNFNCSIICSIYWMQV